MACPLRHKLGGSYWGWRRWGWCNWGWCNWSWCRWGWRNAPICFSLCFLFSFVRFRLSSLFFVFVHISSLFSLSPRTSANNCNLLGQLGTSLRPRLRRPRSELPEQHRFFKKQFFFGSLSRHAMSNNNVTGSSDAPGSSLPRLPQPSSVFLN